MGLRHQVMVDRHAVARGNDEQGQVVEYQSIGE
jgi:hypothetical protein